MPRHHGRADALQRALGHELEFIVFLAALLALLLWIAVGAR